MCSFLAQGAPTGREGDQGTALRLARIALLKWGSTGLQSPGLQQQDDASSWSTILLDGLDLWHLDPLGLGPSAPHTLRYNHCRDHGQMRTSDIDHGTDVRTVFLGVRDRAKIYISRITLGKRQLAAARATVRSEGNSKWFLGPLDIMY